MFRMLRVRDDLQQSLVTAGPAEGLHGSAVGAVDAQQFPGRKVR
nr:MULTISPECIES: hypothetical protein [unclassified Pseudarthrobacter]